MTDPLIQALTDRLPHAGHDFPELERERWLTALFSALNLLYPPDTLPDEPLLAGVPAALADRAPRELPGKKELTKLEIAVSTEDARRVVDKAIDEMSEDELEAEPEVDDLVEGIPVEDETEEADNEPTTVTVEEPREIRPGVMTWTENEDAILRDAIKKGRSPNSLTIDGRSQAAITSRYYAMKKEVETKLRMSEAEEVAERKPADPSGSPIMRRLRDLERPFPWTYQLDLELVELLTTGSKAQDVAAVLEIEKQAVVDRFKLLCPNPDVAQQARVLDCLAELANQ